MALVACPPAGPRIQAHHTPARGLACKGLSSCAPLAGCAGRRYLADFRLLFGAENGVPPPAALMQQAAKVRCAALQHAAGRGSGREGQHCFWGASCRLLGEFPVSWTGTRCSNQLAMNTFPAHLCPDGRASQPSNRACHYLMSAVLSFLPPRRATAWPCRPQPPRPCRCLCPSCRRRCRCPPRRCRCRCRAS